MCDPQMKDLLEQFSKTALLAPVPVGVSFRGKGLKLHTPQDGMIQQLSQANPPLMIISFSNLFYVVIAYEVVKAIRGCPEMTYLDLEGNTLGVDAAKAIGDALRDRPKLTRALWKDMFTGRMKTEIPKALVKDGEPSRAEYMMH